jgi:predicted transcriptional regulator
MKLAAYLAQQGLTHKAFGDLIGATQAAVSRYAKGERCPDRRRMEQIAVVTKGSVTPNDFFDVERAHMERAG